MKTIVAFVATLATAGLAFADGAVPMPAGPQLQTAFAHAAQVKVIDQNGPARAIADAARVQAVEKAIGGAQSADAKVRRRCIDTLRLEFVDGKGELLGTAAFCGTGGLSGAQPFEGAEFSFGAKGGRGRISVADAAALAKALKK